MPEPMVAAIDLGDLLEYLIPLLVAAGWILSRLAAVIRGLAGPAAKPPAAPRDLQRELARRAAPAPLPPAMGQQRPPRPAGGKPAGPADPREELARQIEDFLAGRRGPTVPQPGLPQSAAPSRPVDPGRRSPSPQPSKPASMTSSGRGSRPAGSPTEVHPGAVAKGTGGPVGALGTRPTDVARHMEESFGGAGRAPLPGAPVPRPGPPAADQAPTPIAAELVAALRDPATLRRMILLREILDRPVARW